MKPRRSSLVTLPPSIDLTIFLIREELKCSRFFSALTSVGAGDSFYRPRLGSAILSHTGFSEAPDDVVELYRDLILKHCQLIEENLPSVNAAALDVYAELITEAKRRSRQDNNTKQFGVDD